MKSIVTARFDDRDSADLALMRLRRSGVRFDFTGLLINGGERGANAGVFSPYSINMVNQPGASDSFFPPVGSRAIFSNETSVPKREVLLKLLVSGEDIPQARDIIRSVGGRHIEVI